MVVFIDHEIIAKVNFSFALMERNDSRNNPDTTDNSNAFKFGF